MAKEKIPTGIESNSGQIEFSKINQDFSATQHGHQLAGGVRYDRYKPSNMKNIEWERLLGVDVNNLKHLQLTYGLTRQFIKYSEEAKLTLQEQEDLLLAAIVHDWAEAIVGDKSYDLKTASQEDTEFQELKKMLGDIYGQNDSGLLARINHVTDTIIKDRNTKLGKIFNTVERVGYLRTGLFAWQKSKENGGDLKTGLEWLTNNVFLNQISTLIEYSKIYPAVTMYLKEKKDFINDAFNNLPDDVFKKYTPEEVDKQKSKFELGKKDWQEYYQKLSL